MRLWLLLAIGCGKDEVSPCASDFERDSTGACVKIEAQSATPNPDSAEPPNIQDTADPPEESDQLKPLDSSKLLRRMSLDLLGVLPTTVQLDAVESDPSALDAWIEEALSDPRWTERLVHIFGKTWHTQVDDFQLLFQEYDNLYLDDSNEYPFERSAGEEPLRLLAHVASNDVPWSEVLTADYTMSNEILSSIWPIEYTGP